MWVCVCVRSVDWHEGEEDSRKKTCIFVSDLLAVYKYHSPLHAGMSHPPPLLPSLSETKSVSMCVCVGDDESWNFQWVDCDNAADNLLAFLRKYGEWYNDILVICNFSGNTYYR